VPELVSSDAKRLLLMVLYRSGRKPGASIAELRKEFGDRLEELVEELNEKLAELGLRLHLLEEEGLAVIAPSEPVGDIKLSPLDSNAVACLGILVGLFTAGRGVVKRSEFLEVASRKVGEAEAKICLGELAREGYVKVKGDEIQLSWRAFFELDVEKLAESLAREVLKLSG